MDSAMRGWMNEGRSYIEPVANGDVMRSSGAGQEDALVSADAARGLTKVDPKLAPLPVYVGALGITGLTAYFGLLEVGKAKAGDTVVVSGAGGATGMVA